MTPTIAEIAAELARLRLDAENYARQAGEASLMYGVLFRRIARLEESLDVLRNEPDEIEAPPAPVDWVGSVPPPPEPWPAPPVVLYGDRHEGNTYVDCNEEYADAPDLRDTTPLPPPSWMGQ